MKDFFPILAASPLFSGVTEDELDAMLTCLAAKTEQFPKDVFLLHPGDKVKEIGMVLSPQPHHPKPSERPCGKKPAAQ